MPSGGRTQKLVGNQLKMEPKAEDNAMIESTMDLMAAPQSEDPEVTRRSIGLMLAIRYYTETIIKEGDMLRVILEQEQRMKANNDPEAGNWHTRPCNVNRLIGIAIAFERYLRGEFSGIEVCLVDGEPMVPKPKEEGDESGETPPKEDGA